MNFKMCHSVRIGLNYPLEIDEITPRVFIFKVLQYTCLKQCFTTNCKLDT